MDNPASFFLTLSFQSRKIVPFQRQIKGKKGIDGKTLCPKKEPQSIWRNPGVEQHGIASPRKSDPFQSVGCSIAGQKITIAGKPLHPSGLVGKQPCDGVAMLSASGSSAHDTAV
jgi:hypothetical protein